VREVNSSTTSATPALEFAVRGFVDGRPTAARWRDDQLTCDPAVLVRARLVVALGDAFEVEGAEPLRASLTGPPLAVMLTIIRAFSRVTAVEVAQGSPR
jgi:hypothetical protein